MLVFIGKLSLSTLRRIPICQGFSHFSVFLLHFVLAKLATSSIRVKCLPTAPHWVSGIYHWQYTVLKSPSLSCLAYLPIYLDLYSKGWQVQPVRCQLHHLFHGPCREGPSTGDLYLRLLPKTILFLRPKKKVVCFLRPYPNKLLLQKIPTLVFSTLPIPNQHKMCIKYTFLNKK